MPSTTISNRFYYVYVLEGMAHDTRRYIGFTTDLRKRVAQHNAGHSFATAPRRPFALIYYEACLSRVDAMRRERYLKGTGGRRFLSKRLKDYLFA